MTALASTGASVAITGSALTMTTKPMSNTSGNTYAINDATLEIWDPDTALEFFDGGSPIAASGIVSVDPLHGKVTLASPPSGAVTVTGKSLPKTTVATAKSVEFTVGQNQLVDTPLGQAGQTREGGLKTVSGNMTLNDPDLGTTVGGGDSIWEMLVAGTPMVIEVDVGGTQTFRCLAKLTEGTIEAGVDALVESGLSFRLAADTFPGGWHQGFGWG